MRKQGFEPLYSSNSEILILGSFPSVKSRIEEFYYGNKQNKFWKLMATLLNESMPETILAKKELLISHKIALWDVVESCEIEGSLDTNIKCPIIADIPFLISQTNITKILCNGQKSYALLCKHFPNLAPIAICMPSTSPANTKFDANTWKITLQGQLYL